jgi:3',5'-cyclic AMP phosphodiesterase CpdA
MKHLVIGDLHGKDCWKQVKTNAYDKVIFIGDYVDHWTLPDHVITQNLLEIIELKKEHPETFELLLGNHDVQYLHYPNFLCSGFRPQMQRKLTYVFDGNRNLFNIAYQRGLHLFSHAGVTNKWYAEFLELPILEQIRDENDTMADLFNKIERTGKRDLLHRAGSSRGGWGAGGITWADKKELIDDALEGYHQVAGHTVIHDIEEHKFAGKSITLIDVLDYQTRFYEIDC